MDTDRCVAVKPAFLEAGATRRMKPFLALVAALYVFAVSSPVQAHAILMRSDPAPGTTVPAGLLKITLDYNSRIDFERSVVKLIGPGGSPMLLTLHPTDVNVAGADADVTELGAYTLRWQVLASDGHITRGVVPFTVIGQHPAPGQH